MSFRLTIFTRLIRVLLGTGFLAGFALSETVFAALDFMRDIEPILIKRCYECHGPDKQKSDLRLDSRAAALRPAKSGGLPLVPSRPLDSELLKRVASTDPDEVMPPKGPRLTSDEVTALREWITAGAVWPEKDTRKHWSFQSPIHPTPPTHFPAGSIVRNEIDRFILERLNREGLQPQPEADRATLIRRVALDLTGLPPNPIEIDTFLHDSTPNAYETLVDRLLASPHYGEHMARGWLDLARYADSNGYQVDLARSIWPYREWVINAFNKNQPFNDFTIEQLAGDLLTNPTLDQRIATGFNRNTKVNDEGGGDAEEYRTKAVKDRVATLGTTWLGLTLACAECHSHKYDPISHDDYYQFYAFFNNSTDNGNYSTGPNVEVPRPDLTVSEAYTAHRLNEVRRELVAEQARLKSTQVAWERKRAIKGPLWTALTLTNATSTGGSSFTNLPDGSLLGLGVNPIYDTVTVEASTLLTGITAVLLEVLPDPSLPKKGPGRWGQTGNFILDEFSLSLVKTPTLVGDKSRAETRQESLTPLLFSQATADWEQLYYKAAHAVDHNPKTGWAIGPRFGERHFLIAQLQKPVAVERGNRLSFRFDQYHGNSHCIGRFRISITTEPDSSLWWPMASTLVESLHVKPVHRSPAQSAEIVATHHASSETLRSLQSELIRLEEKQSQLAARTFSSMILQERTDPQPRETYVHLRGDFLSRGKAVTAGVPSLFPSLSSTNPLNRLALARWIVDPTHPLTARVTVNRFWERCFGTGLVKTSEDFGLQGEAPSHPELLDWLATEFIRTGWDVKAMQKQIVLSATYRQNAAADATRLEKDFYNRLLSRGPRFRMDAEMIRDHALSVSGLLNRQRGGPSMYPVQVPNLWKEIGFLRPEIGMDEWPVSEGPDLYRRALYTFWRRVCTYPTLATFDAPSRDVCVSRRPRSNTPLQALAAMNEPTLLEAARVFAQRILTECHSDDPSRIQFAFRTCLGRPPDAAELKRLLAFVKQQREGYRRDPQAASALIKSGSALRPKSLDAPSLATWMMLANLLFNLDETLTKG